MSNLAVRVVADDDLTTHDWMILQDIATGEAACVIRESASGEPGVMAEALNAFRAVLKSRPRAA